MNTNFIFNQTTLNYPDILDLIQELLNNLFLVMIISDQFTTEQLKKIIHLDKVILIGCDQAENLPQLYLKAYKAREDNRYLTVVFENNSSGIKIAKKLGLYVIPIKEFSLKKIFKKLKITEVHQLQYLPEIKKFKNFLKYKMGYPVSIYQCLKGYFTKSGVALTPKGKSLSSLPLPNFGNFNFYINNIGDPFILSKSFIGHTCLFEQEVIRILGEYYGLPSDQARGFVTSGGSEANFAGLWWARDNLRGNIPNTAVAIYYSTASHYSIEKIALQLGLEPHSIPAYPTEEINLQCLRTSIQEHMQKTPTIPIIFSANAGTTKFGAIDDLQAIKEILETEVQQQGGHYLLHLDAAFLGAVLPLIKPYGKNIDNYFTALGISTLSVSPHKFLGTTSICGIVLTTQKFLQESTKRQSKKIAYVGEIHDITPSGSRSGNAVLQIHNLLYSLDFHTHKNRLQKLLTQSQQNCQYFYQKMSIIVDTSQITWLKNSFSIIFPKPSEYLIRKYSLMPISSKTVGVYGLINLNKALIDLFIEEYKREHRGSRPGHLSNFY